MTMLKEEKLIELTNKFLLDFFAIDSEKDEYGFQNEPLTSFNYTLPKILSKCDIPTYKEVTTLLMGMSSFDDEIAKQFFNIRLKGFLDVIETKLNYTGEQEDYYLKNIEHTVSERECLHFKWDTDDFETVKGVEPIYVTTFDVSNSRNNFTGSVKVVKHNVKHFHNPNDYTDVVEIDYVDFYNSKKERIMSISRKFGYNDENDFNKYNDVGEFTHYKHIADINSFFTVINNI